MRESRIEYEARGRGDVGRTVSVDRDSSRFIAVQLRAVREEDCAVQAGLNIENAEETEELTNCNVHFTVGSRNLPRLQRLQCLRWLTNNLSAKARLYATFGQTIALGTEEREG